MGEPDTVASWRQTLVELMRDGQYLAERGIRSTQDILETLDEEQVVKSRWLVALGWSRSGCPRVVLGHRHAAALMLTRVPDDLAEVVFPWPCFAVDVPEGLVAHEGRAIDHVFFAHGRQLSSGEPTAFLIGVPRVATKFDGICGIRADNVCALVAAARTPAEKLLSRYAVGVAIELTQHRPALAHAAGDRAVRRGPRGEPVTATFQLTRDVKVDCRQAVRDYCARGGREAPSVQSLVRGHWKNQPHGPGRAERKRLFVEPYWRGPEDAPIALRSHVLQTAEKG